MHLRRVTLAAAAAMAATTVALLCATQPAYAHNELRGSTPATGSTVTTAPTEVTLQFAEAVGTSTTVTVTGPGGTDVAAGPPRLTGAQAVVALRSPLPNGAYTAAYRTVSSDGDPISGTITFTLAAPTPSAAPPTTPEARATAYVDTGSTQAGKAAASTDGGRRGPWAFIGITVVAIAVSTAAAVALQRRRAANRR